MKSDRFRAAAEAKDFSAIDELFAEDATFRSPVVFKPYQGHEAIAVLLGAVIQVFEGFRYVDQVETGDTAARG
jgi:ketosteroid isomerase-like protein